MNFTKKMAAVEMIILFCAVTLAGCGRSYDADTNTVYILDKGEVVSTDVDSFSDEYDKTEFETFVKDEVAAYTKEHGEDTVELDKLEVADGKAAVTLKYASAEDYSRFTGTELFTGSVTEALTAGYDFDVSFANADSGAGCDTSEVLEDSSLNVVIIKGNVNVEVGGDIVYYSQENVRLTGDRTVSIGQEKEPESTEPAEDETDGTESGEDLETETGTEADEGSVDDDELLAGTESTEIVFDFDEDYNAAESDQPDQETGDIYTYIVYE